MLCILYKLFRPEESVPISYLEGRTSLRRLFGAGMSAAVLLLILFTLYAIRGMEIHPLAPNMIFGYFNLLFGILGMGLIVRDAVVGGVRLFLLGMLGSVMLQPYFVLPQTLPLAFMVNPLIIVSLLIVAGLFFTRRSLYYMLALVGAALIGVLWFRGDAEVRARLPIILAAVIGVAIALYYWAEVVFQALRNANEAARRADERARERDLMLREAHHRIKNNLGIVNALIHMKMQELPEEHAIGDLSMQIRTIMLLHEKLHSQEWADANSIKLARHISDVLNIVFSSSKGAEVAVRSSISDELTVDPKQAVPLGLIVHELAMNALKYSFSGEPEPHFTLYGSYRQEGGTFLLTIEHSGTPLPEDFSFQRQDTLGLQLVDALVAQLGGTIEVQRKPHPAFFIRFPL